MRDGMFISSLSCLGYVNGMPKSGPGSSSAASGTYTEPRGRRERPGRGLKGQGERYVIHHAKASSARSTERHGKRRLGGLLAILALALCALGSGASAASAEAPVLTMGTATAPSYASAHVAGEVDPNGEPVEWFFEVSTDGTDWQRAGVSGGFSDPIPTTPQ